jgi:hypothetical protein
MLTELTGKITLLGVMYLIVAILPEGSAMHDVNEWRRLASPHRNEFQGVHQRQLVRLRL